MDWVNYYTCVLAAFSAVGVGVSYAKEKEPIDRVATILSVLIALPLYLRGLGII